MARHMLVVLALVAAACSSTNNATPGPSSGPAFAAAAAPKPVDCPSDVHARECVRIAIVNAGDAGGGFCRLRGANGAFGPSFPVSGAAGTTTVHTVAVPPSLHGQQLGTSCEPTMRS
ncbi:MAG: hypothetical protein ACXVP7_06950 [Actinomycetota bacterium]